MTEVQARPNGAWETARNMRLYRRLTLRRADGQVYLNRWGIGHDRVGGILLHKMEAPDPGVDLHDHPWWFVNIILWGGYHEQRAETRQAPMYAALAERYPGKSLRGVEEERKPFSVKVMRQTDCHTVTALRRRTSWSLVIKGPRRGAWGFYMDGAGGYMDERQYDETVRADRRDLWSEQAVAEGKS